MNTETKFKVIEALEAFMGQHGMSANEVAKKTGVNAAYISNMRAGNFKVKTGDMEVNIANKYFEKIAELIGFELETGFWKTEATPQLMMAISTLEDARNYGYTVAIIGQTGSGKTFAADIFAHRYPMDTFVIKVGSQDNISDLIEKLCEALHIHTEKSKSRSLRLITKKLKALKSDGLNPTVVFDESEYMKQPALCNLKEMYDHLNGVAGLVMVGTDQLISNIEKMRLKNKPGIPQLYRRVKFGIRYLPAIDRSFKQFLNKTIEDKNLIQFLRANCDNYGELHDVLVPAMREAERSGEPLTENLIRKMLNMPNN